LIFETHMNFFIDDLYIKLKIYPLYIFKINDGINLFKIKIW
jgi:hypothetical protein